jgi:hypothetical protein
LFAWKDGYDPFVRGLVVGVGVLAVVVAGGLVLVLTRDDPDEPPAFLSPCGTVIEPQGDVRTQTVLIIGDSIMAQASCPLAGKLAAAGMESHLHAVSGSGLLSGMTKWNRAIDDLLDSVDPDVVIGEFVGNYNGKPAVDGNGQPIAKDSEAWYALWQKRAQELTDRVHDAGAQMIWVSAPPMDDGGRAARLFQGFAPLGDRALPSGQALGGPNGEWIATCGSGPALRDPDTVHLSPEGASAYGDAIAADFLSPQPVSAPCRVL